MTAAQPERFFYRHVIPCPLTEAAARVLDVRDPTTGELVWPITPELLKWTVAEGLYRQAESDAMEVVDLQDVGVVPVEKVNPQAVQQLAEAGAPRDEIEWHAFLGVARRPTWSIWCEAEAMYNAGQAALEVAETLELASVTEEEPDAPSS